MASKQQQKLVQSLKIKKYRQLHGLFMAEGEKIVAEILKTGYAVKQLYALPQWLEQHADILKKKYPDTEIIPVPDALLHKLSALETPNNVLAVCPIMPPKLDENTLHTHLSLALCNLQDPGNLGAVIRIADWFGVPYVFCSPQCVDVFNPKVIQATMGSFLRVQVFYQPLQNLFAQYPQLPVYGAVLQGSNLFTTPPPTSGAALLVGSESHGIDPALMPYVHHPVTIPRRGGAESLNAAVATGIITSYLTMAAK